jgi:predicted nucleotidyltransferase
MRLCDCVVVRNCDQMPFVSFRLSENDRNRLRAMLAGSGRTVQEFMEETVRNSLQSQDSAGVQLTEALRTLRRHKDDLCARNIKHMWIFGSVARGEERSDSDVDIIVDLDPKAKVSLTSFTRLQLDLGDILGRPVDLATWKTLREHIVEDVTRDAVMVF